MQKTFMKSQNGRPLKRNKVERLSDTEYCLFVGEYLTNNPNHVDKSTFATFSKHIYKLYCDSQVTKQEIAEALVGAMSKNLGVVS